MNTQSFADYKDVEMGCTDHMFCRSATLTVLLTLTLTLQGCLFVPPVKVSSDEVIPFEDSQLENVQTGVTSKADVLEILGTPGIEFSSGSVWVYEDVYHEDWFYMFAAAGAGPFGFGGGGGRYEKDIPHFLIIRFDEADKLTNHQVVPLGDNYVAANLRCNEGLCASWLATANEDGTQLTVEYRGIYSVFAPDSIDERAKQFQMPTDRCGVYLYWNENYPLESWLDGQPAGWLLNKKQFFFWRLDPGTHHLFARAIRPSSRQVVGSAYIEDQLVRVNCTGGSLYFFEPTTKLKLKPLRNWVELQQRDVAEGQKAIGKRQLVLSTWDDSRKARPVILSPDMELRVIEPDMTTRDDVIARFGPPEFEFNEIGLMAYIKNGPVWFELIGVENGMQMLGQQYLLFLRFNSDGIAIEYELRSINLLLDSSIAYLKLKSREKGYEDTDGYISCIVDGYCVAAGGLLARYATASETKSAKRARAGKNDCLINVFSGERNTTWRVFLDGQFAAYIYDALWPRGFLQWRLPIGNYSITAEIVKGLAELATEQSDATAQPQSDTVQITCEGRDKYYLPLINSGNGPYLALTHESRGKKNVNWRNLIQSDF